MWEDRLLSREGSEGEGNPSPEAPAKSTPEKRVRFARENQEGRGSWQGEYVGRFAR